MSEGGVAGVTHGAERVSEAEAERGPVLRKSGPDKERAPRRPPAGEERPVSKLRKYSGLAIAGLFIAGIGYLALRPAQAPVQPQGRRGGGETGPVSVVAQPARIADVPVTLDGVGTARALNTVVVQPQVDGKLISVNFKEGQDVKKGDVLAKIDPITFKAQYDQAVAKKATDQVQLANAKADLERYLRVGTLAVTQKAIDTQKALVAQFEAQIRQDQAAIDSVAAVLSYAEIIAPISGRTGIRQVDEGNIVHPSTSTLVTITQVQPIAVLFNLPQQQLGQVNKAFAKGALKVEALAPDNKTAIDTGTLTVVNNQVDQATGTVQMKAEFPNADLQLWPGQFANIRLLVDTLKGVTVTPVAAVQRGPTGPFVYTIEDSDKGSSVAMRAITITQQDDIQAVLASGVTAGERVVTSGFARLAPGSRVTVTGPDAAPPATDSPVLAPAGKGPNGAAGGKRQQGAGDAAPVAGGERGKGKGGGKRKDGAGAPSANAPAPANPPSASQ